MKVVAFSVYIYVLTYRQEIPEPDFILALSTGIIQRGQRNH